MWAVRREWATRQDVAPDRVEQGRALDERDAAGEGRCSHDSRSLPCVTPGLGGPEQARTGGLHLGPPDRDGGVAAYSLWTAGDPWGWGLS